MNRKAVYQPTAFARRLQEFLCEFSPNAVGASPNTLSSYCSAFRQYLLHREMAGNVLPDALDLRDFTAESVEAFLNWVEKDCGRKTATRNQRLAAIHSFCRYLMRKEPLYISNFQQILAIPVKKHPTKTMVDYLTVDETAVLLGSIDISTPIGRRDVVLLSVMYDTGARVQEIADLTVGDIKLSTKNTSLVYLTGKWRKTRSVPLSTASFELLSQFFCEKGFADSDTEKSPTVFTNRNGGKLTRHGISFILSRHLEVAVQQCPSLKAKSVSPHTLRHSKAMHLLQAKIDLIKIRDFLGHASVSTTEIYARTNDSEIRTALENSASTSMVDLASWHKDPGIMERLSSFARRY